MQNMDLLNEIAVWIKGNVSGIIVSIVASIIWVVLKMMSKFFKRVYENVGGEDRKGLDYIIVHPFRNETSRDIRINGIKFFIKMFIAYVPFLLLLIVFKIAELVGKLDAIGAFGCVLCAFVLALYILYAQKRYRNHKKICEIIETTLIAIIILFSFSISVMALGVYENRNLMYYAALISLFLFFVIDFIFESRSSEQYYIKWIDKIRWIRYFGMIIGYSLSFGKLSNVGLRILFCSWFIVCGIEDVCANLFGKKSLAPYTVKCKEGTYITHDNILQMRDGKVNFKIEDQYICIIDKEEIEYITYEMENPRRQRKDDKNKIIYISKDRKACICDKYVYIGKDWIEFRKKNVRNIEITIMPSEQISSIRSCNKEACNSIIDGKER